METYSLSISLSLLEKDSPGLATRSPFNNFSRYGYYLHLYTTIFTPLARAANMWCELATYVPTIEPACRHLVPNTGMPPP